MGLGRDQHIDGGGATALGALLALALAWSIPAVAEGQGLSAAERQAAAEAAYDRGSAAFRGGDYSTAARWYETANDLAPSANALVQAVRSHDRAGNELRAGTLALALVERYDDERVTQYVQPIIERVAPTAVRVDVHCEQCEVQIDGEAEDQRSFFLRPHTEHRIVATFSTGSAEERVTGAPGDEREVTLTAPESQSQTGESSTDGSGAEGLDASDAAGGTEQGGDGGDIHPPPSVHDGGGGLSPAFVVVGAVLTAAAGGVLIWSGLDTLSARDDYEQMPTRAKLDNGRDLELRTNILIGATAGLGALTLIFAALADWGGDDGDVAAAFAPLPEGGGVVAARGRLP